MRRLIVLMMLLSPAVALGQWGDLIKKGLGLDSQTGLSEAKIGSGLKEALKVGTENTVRLTGKTDGYFANEAIKILMPESLRKLEKPLRMVGYGQQIDEFVLSMNRAAEQAAPSAKKIFWDAIAQMTFDDAKNILDGGDTAATDYFRGKTSHQLAETFRPVVEESMNEVGVSRKYKELIGRYEAIPFSKSVTFDSDQYVVDKAIGGLFYVLGQEEKKIRTNPAARATDLLKEVFGK